MADRTSTLVTARFVILGLMLIAAAGFWPIPALVAPQWSIHVVSRTGEPLKDIVVRESYKDYSAELEGHQEDQRPDDRGNVVFSRKVISASLFKRLFVMTLSATGGVHASYGPDCFVFAFGENLQSSTLDWKGSPQYLESTIVVYSDAHGGTAATDR